VEDLTREKIDSARDRLTPAYDHAETVDQAILHV